MDQLAALPTTIIESHKGEQYLAVLSRLHASLKPRTYFEIGARTGSSLALAACGSIAIDPAFHLDAAFMGKKDSCCLYQISSDEFFARRDPERILGAKIDFAFLDGMHLAEFLLRDFCNVEPHCNRNSVIALHDCIPLDAAMARRRVGGGKAVVSTNYPNWWTGDVWKLVPILRKYRPELRIYAVDAQPTGLVLVTNLDPGSSILGDRYFDILDELGSMNDRSLETYLMGLDLMPTSAFGSADQIARYFYL
jgi:hypothetical protein